MLKRLKLKNFQKHKRLDLTFESGVNSITGQTDAGKSAVLRAIRWICLNIPSGDSFIRSGQNEAAGRLLVDEHTVTRKRGKENTYTLDDNPPYSSFQRGVPEPVENVLRVAGINFAGQHDSPFWFGLSAPEVSRQLNDIIDLDIIDTAMQKASKRLNTARVRAEVLSTELKEAREKKKNLQWVKACNDDYLDIEAMEAERDELDREINILDLHITKVRVGAKELRREEAKAEDARSVLDLAKTILGRRRDRNRLEQAVDDAVELGETMLTEQPDLSRVSTVFDQYLVLDEEIDDLVTAIHPVEQYKSQLDTINKDLELAKEDLAEVEVCPLCGSAM